MKQKKKLRIFISNTSHPAREAGPGEEAPSIASWELRVEGKLMDESKQDPAKVRIIEAPGFFFLSGYSN